MVRRLTLQSLLLVVSKPMLTVIQSPWTRATAGGWGGSGGWAINSHTTEMVCQHIAKR